MKRVNDIGQLLTDSGAVFVFSQKEEGRSGGGESLGLLTGANSEKFGIKDVLWI